MPRHFGIHDLMVLLAATTLLLLQMEGFADDPGVGWHLRDGLLMLERRELPQYDPFLFSANPRQWVSDQWLSDVIFGWLYSHGGWPLLYAAGAVLYLSLFMGFLYVPAARWYGTWLGASVAVFLAFKAGEIHFILRPVLLSFLLFGAVNLITLWMSRHAEESKKILPPLMMLMLTFVLFLFWANLHPSFVLGLGLLVLLFAALVCDGLLLGRPVRKRALVWTGALGFVAGVATLFNPYGIALHKSIWQLGKSEYFMSLHDEWQPLDFGSAEGEIFMIIVGIVLLSLFVAGSQRIRLKSFEFFSFLAFAVLSIRAVRFLPYFAIVSIPVVTDLLANFSRGFLFGPLGRLRKFGTFIADAESRERRSSKGIALIVVCLVILGFAMLRQTMVLHGDELGPSRSRYPYGAINALREMPLDYLPVVAAAPAWGGFITLIGQGKVRAVIDDRNTLLGEEFYRRYFEMLKPGEQAPGFLQELGVTHLLLSRTSPLAAWVEGDARFIEVFKDEVAVLYLFDAMGGTVAMASVE